MKSIRWRIWIVITLLLILGACTKAGPATPETTPIPPTNTQVIPSATSSPTVKPATSTPTPAPITMEIPECVADGSGGNLDFSETLMAASTRMSDWESYRFNTLYEFLSDGNYSTEELSVQIQGEYSGLQETLQESLPYYYLSSQKYFNARVVYTDLRLGQQNETIITPAGFWYRSPGENNWMAIEGATGADLYHFGELLSPESIVYLLDNPNFQPGIQADKTTFEKNEMIDGISVIHRCWIIPNRAEEEDAYLIHGNYIYILLKDAVVHLWTADDDRELVRLVLTGSHIGEFYHEGGIDLHDAPSQFLLWMDVDQVNQPITINTPPDDEVVTTLAKSTSLHNDNNYYPFNDLPLPKEANLKSAISFPTTPLEYYIEEFNINDGLMYWYFRRNWSETPTDRVPQYTVQASISNLSGFYQDQMTLRGWTLSNKFLEAGLNRLFLFFQREEVTLPVILTSQSDNSTLIQAYLPPKDEVLNIVRHNWVFFDETDNPILAEDINSIAIDSQGQAWLGTESGISLYNGTTWTDIAAEEIGVEQKRITAVAIDQKDAIWVGSSDGISYYDGTSWSTDTKDSNGNSFGWVETIFISKNGQVWAGLSDGRISIYDGVNWKTYTRDNGGPGTSHDITAIADDPAGNIWIGTTGGGIFSREGDVWRTIAKDINPPDATSSSSTVMGMTFDHRGWLWVTIGGSIQVYDGKIWHEYSEYLGNLPYSDINQVIVDQYDRIWVVSSYYELAMQGEDSQWIIYSPIISPEDSHMFYAAAAIDSSGKIWIGTTSGLGIFTTPPSNSAVVRSPLPTPQPTPPVEPLPEAKPGWTSYALEGTPLRYGIDSIAVDQQNHIWLAGWGVIDIDANGIWNQYTRNNTPASGLLSDSVNDIAFDKQNRIWMATDNGLAVLNQARGWTNYSPETSDLPDRHVKDIEIDAQDRLWAWAIDNNSSDDSLSVISADGSWITYTEETLTYLNEKPLAFVTAIEADHQGRLWIANFYGLTALSKDGSMQAFTNADLGLTDNWEARVTALFADDQDRIWIGTSTDGVFVLFNDGILAQYSPSVLGLYSGEITTLMIDDIGRAWVGSEVGLSVLNTDGNWTTYTGDNSDLPSSEITALAIDQLDRVWVGTAAGLAVYVWPPP